MKTLPVCLLAAAMVSAAAHSPAATLLWSDEFDGTSIDTAKWNIYDKADGSDSWFKPSNLVVNGGILQIYNFEELYNTRHWTGGGIESKYFPQYKYLEARIKHSAPDTYIWATWWTVGWNGSLVWPPELDISEFQGAPGKSPGQTYHYLTSGGAHTWKGCSTAVDESQWHTYGVYWNATDSPVFYVDGQVTCVPGLGSGQPPAIPMKFKLTSSPNSGTRFSGCTLGIMQIDYVRVYDAPPSGGPTPTVTSAPTATPTPRATARATATASGSTLLSHGHPAVASSVENSSHGPALAVDGDTTTRWSSAFSDPQWIYVDLGASHTVSRVLLNWQNAYGKAYQIQTSTNASTWTNIYSTTTGDGGIDDLTVSGSGRYVRMYGTTRAGNYGYSLYELQVFGQ